MNNPFLLQKQFSQRVNHLSKKHKKEFARRVFAALEELEDEEK